MRRRPAVLAAALALILAAAAAMYSGGLDRPFFADDYLFLDQVRDRPLLEALTSVDPLSNFYRPVSRQLYFWVVSAASGESEVAYRVTSVVLFLLLLLALFWTARAIAGTQPALIATGMLALHYAPDVAVRWACGSQELLSVGFALLAIGLYVRGRAVWAGVAMLIAALSKEVVLLAPLIAVAAGRRPGEPWRAAFARAWPLGAAMAVWLALFLLLPHTRSQQATEVELDPTGPLAAIVHLVQVALGAEWQPGRFSPVPGVPPPLLPLALVLAAVLGARALARWRGTEEAAPPAGAASSAQAPATAAVGPGAAAGNRRRAGAASSRPVRLGLGWALLASAPVAAVAPLWSAYYYVFAMCGVALAAGALLAPRHPAWTALALFALAWSSANARAIPEFATPRSPWTSLSHINAFYMERSARVVGRYLEDLRRTHPAFPPGSTLFFAGLPGNIAFQVADGPLLRWAYRDPTLRSHYLYDFSRERAERGPVFVFFAEGDSLKEVPQTPDLYRRLAYGMILSDQPRQALEALEMHVEGDPADADGSYWMAWLHWELRELDAARAALARAGYPPREPTGDTATLEAALVRVHEGDTLGALAVLHQGVRESPLDAGLHGLLADVYLTMDRDLVNGPIEAFAARALAPRHPLAWRRWAMIQLDRRRHLQALASFERYFALGGQVAARDTDARRWMESIRTALPGGVFAPGETGH